MRIVKAANNVLPLGKQGENLATQVQFTVEAWIKELGDGTFQMLHQRKTDQDPHAVTIRYADGIVYWDIANTEVAVVGYGKCELQFYKGAILAKSKTWITQTVESLSDAGDTPPEPWESWVEEVLQAGSQAQEAAEDAEEAKEAAEDARDSAQGYAENAAGSAAQAGRFAAAAEGYADNAFLYKNAAEDARDAAIAAKTAAETAQEEAESAESGAVQAKQGALAAEENARAYAENAEQSKTGAETAKAQAVTAKNEAQSHAADARTSKTAAETAKNEAVAAKTAAETAKTNAEAARDAAVTAKNDAVSAKTAAETAKTQAETAKTDAETAKTGAETAQDAAEDSAKDAEAWAVGKRDGTDVPSTDPTYQNNSQYYADESKQARDDVEDSVEGVAQEATAQSALDKLTSIIGHLQTIVNRHEEVRFYNVLPQTGTEGYTYITPDGTFHFHDGVFERVSSDKVKYVDVLPEVGMEGWTYITPDGTYHYHDGEYVQLSGSGDLNGFSLNLGTGNEVILSYVDPDDETITDAITMPTLNTIDSIISALGDIVTSLAKIAGQEE